jgi:PAS domain S-box-containing protein
MVGPALRWAGRPRPGVAPGEWSGLGFETLLSGILSGLINVPPQEIESAIEQALRRVVGFLDFDRAGLYLLESDRLIRRVSWEVEDAPLRPPAFEERARFPWVIGRLQRGESVRFSRPDELPEEAAVDRQSFAERGTQSHFSIGLRAGGSMVGILALGSPRPGWVCSDELTGRLRLLGEVFAGALARRDAALALDERLRFETLVSEISSTLINAAPADLEPVLEHALEAIVTFLGLERGALHLFVGGRPIQRVFWGPADGPPSRSGLDYGRLPWAMERWRRGEIVRFARLDELPAEAGIDRETFAERGVQSHISIGLRTASSMVVTLSLSSTRPGWACADKLAERLRLLGEIFAGALARRDTARALDERLHFETLLSELSAAFVNLPTAEIGRAIEDGQRRICEALGLDLSTLWEFPGDPGMAIQIRSWIRPGLEPKPPTPGLEAYPWGSQRLRSGEMIAYSSIDDLPSEAAHDKRSARDAGIRSAVVWPLRVRGAVFGAVSFAAIRTERVWPEPLVQGLRLAAQVFANAVVRTQAETTLRESEDRFRLMADAAPVMMWMSGPDGGCTYFNQRWLDFTGRPREREMGTGWAEGVHADDLAQCLRTYDRAFSARQSFTMEYRLRRFDGEHRWVLDHGVPRLDGGDFKGYIGSCVDTTELKATQQALLESKALASTIFTSLYGHVAAVDGDGVIIAVNESWSRFFRENGVDSSLVSVGANYVDVYRAAAGAGDAHARQILEAVRSVLDGGARQVSLEYPSQSVPALWFELAVEPLRRPDGGAVVSYVDVTQRRRAQDEARRQRGELAHALRVTTMGELAGSLAHELNQPLTAILSYAQAARRFLAAASPDLEALRECLDGVIEDDRRAADVIQRIRQLLKKDAVKPLPVNLNAFTEDVVRLVTSDAVLNGVSIELRSAPTLPAALVDSVQIQQVVLNLLVNAIDAAVIGPRAERQVTVWTAAVGPHVELGVHDSGRGIAEDDLERIFEPFFTTKTEGLGMGLAISRSIVEAHGGRIWAENDPSGGAAFRVRLPTERDGAP